MLTIRSATTDDLAALGRCDKSNNISDRHLFLQERLSDNSIYVAVSSDRVVGYIVLEYTFYSQGFLSLLVVDDNFQRSGIGSKLIAHLESICRTEKLFTSTNESNTKAQALLKKCGFSVSGKIENLDDGDPEIIFFKRVLNKTNSASA